MGHVAEQRPEYHGIGVIPGPILIQDVNELMLANI